MAHHPAWPYFITTGSLPSLHHIQSFTSVCEPNMSAHKVQRNKVIIVGAGFGGLGMAVALNQAGEDDFVVLEKFSDVGGVWRDNRYPGCTCDVPSHLYSFSFAPYRSRDKRYPSQQDILTYLKGVAADYALEEKIRLNVEVLEAHYRKDEGCWDIFTSSVCYRADVVIFAIGQLHQPNYPGIPGLEKFTGPVMHSARWDDSIDLENKSVSVIGTGSSAAQMLPTLADVASEVMIYQRDPHWVLPKPDTNFNSVENLLLKLPGAHEAYRRALSHGADMLLSPIPRCRAWRYIVECYAKHNLRRQVSNDELARKLMPCYPIGSKRIVLDNNFYTTLQRGNVKLMAERIMSISEKAIKTGREDAHQKQREKETDVIILATGFRASDSLLPISVRGRDGRCLRKDWEEGAEAFLGLAIWGYPNLFTIAGPNSFNPAGSNPGMKESQVAYIMRCLQLKRERLARSIEVDQGAILKYQGWLTKKVNCTVWSGSVSSWYKHGSGKVTSPWPASRRAFEKKLRKDPRKSFVLEDSFPSGVRLVDSIRTGKITGVDTELEDLDI